MDEIFFYNSPVGPLEIQLVDNNVVRIDFTNAMPASVDFGIRSTTAQKLIKQLNEYFAGNLKSFDLPLVLKGTPFQLKVWHALQEIPYGKTKSYKEIAVQIDNPKAVRAVGMANHVNPIPIIIPCHRVIGSNGKLVGYGGGIHIKEALLGLEKHTD